MESTRTRPIIPITTEIRQITATQISVIRKIRSVRPAYLLSNEAHFSGALNFLQPSTNIGADTGASSVSVSASRVVEILESRQDLKAGITEQTADPLSKIAPKIFQPKQLHLQFAACFAVAHALCVGLAGSGGPAVAICEAVAKGALTVQVLILDQIQALNQQQRIEPQNVIAGATILRVSDCVSNGETCAGRFP